jgi:hypothetical protein
VLLSALHHAMAKGALAKGMLKEVASLAPGVWPAVLDAALPLAAVGTTVLMARFALLVWEHVARRRDAGAPHDQADGAYGTAHAPGGARPSGVWVPWLASVLAAGLLPVAAAGPLGLTAAAPAAVLAVELWLALWPIGVGVGLAAVLASLEARRGTLPEVPAGDALVLYVLGIARLSREAVRVLAMARRVLASVIRSGAKLQSEVRRLSGWLRGVGTAASSLSAAGTMWLLLAAGLLAALWLGASRGR